MTPHATLLTSLSVISAALLALIAVEAVSTPIKPSAAAPPVPVNDLPAATVEDVATLVPVILARPLFSPDRRPKAGPAASGAATDDMPRLAGILIDRAERHAIFQPSGDGKPVTVAEGDQVGGWQVQQITADAVTLTGPKGTQVLQPKADPNLAATATPGTDPMVPGGVIPKPGQANPRQYLPGGMQLPAGVPNPFPGQTNPTQARPPAPQQPSRQPGGAPAAPNRR
jgi:hypothetical protein